ncbi:GGDEF domain-containing protein [Candidimonas sp. SYP-B2681]|uniref:GGDEF domain-containing protein n=1 Tax=Candidimonas sp. SYP-B2681 TaxID=2497686 RepID=UPI001F313E11|nr:GGDEF domain-containing protein [Candidimonas sp. SYP-B2681]
MVDTTQMMATLIQCRVAGSSDEMQHNESVQMLASFRKVLQDQTLTPLYQPIVDLHSGKFIGYEGLIRGPSDSPLHAPTRLFSVARSHGHTIELERLCRKIHIDKFVSLGLAGKLFLNMSPDALMMHSDDMSVSSLLPPQIVGVAPDGIVIELTESEATSDYSSLRQAASDYRGLGLQIAIDDLGEGFSSLRLWSELRPEYVKVDKYFVQGIDNDAVKRQFVRSICEIAQQSKSTVIAEGIETEAELDAVRSLGIQYGQGYLLGRPSLTPGAALPSETQRLLTPERSAKRPFAESYKGMGTARKILRTVPAVADYTLTNDVYDIFKRQPELQVLAVLREGTPVGLIHKLRMLDRLARPYHRELYGNKPCDQFIENLPLIVDHKTSLQDLGHLFTEANPHHLSDGFIITEQGRFIGVGTGFDLIREITQMQIHAARYANPLTQLPGNVPINEHIEALLLSEEPFAVCYCDLDHFKPFNDLYSYRKGDEAIQITASLLRQYIDSSIDFVGHIGGDDFIVVFKSENWRERCQKILDQFNASMAHLYKSDHLAEGGYITENRQGVEVFHSLISISLGVVEVNMALPYSSHQIAEFAALAKTEAKKIPGNSLFVERRSLLGVPLAQTRPGLQ